MNKAYFYSHFCLLFSVIILVSSCIGNAQNKSKSPKDANITSSQPPKVNVYYDLSSGVRAGFLDKEGVLWFGTNDGVYSYNGTDFTKFSVVDGLCHKQVTNIMEDRDGNLWFGTAAGLCRYDRKVFTHIPIPYTDTSSGWIAKVYPVINPNEVYALLQDKKGDFWIGTGGAGAYHYDGKTFTQHLSKIGKTHDGKFQPNWIQSIIEDNDGNIWFSSMSHGGVSRYDGKAFTHFKDGLPYDMVRLNYLDKAGNIWFGTLHHGFSIYDGKTFTNFDDSDGLCNNNIRSIYEDSKGKFWFGSGIGETCIYDGKTFTEFATKEGQNVDNVLFVLEDADNNIWLGGGKGLYRFDGETLTDFTYPKSN